MVKTLADDDDGRSKKVSSRKVTNVAKLFAWCVAKDVLSLTILKVRSLVTFSRLLTLNSSLISRKPLPSQPVPFGNPKPLTLSFLSQFFLYLLLSTQTLSPALLLSSTTTRLDRLSIERVFVKAAPHGSLTKGLGYFFETTMEDVQDQSTGEREKAVVKFGRKVALETLRMGGSIAVDAR